MRAFIAIELSKEIKALLAGLQEELKLSGADIKWVKSENIHLTLKFLGEIDEIVLDKAIKILGDIALDISPFQISLCSLGAFPEMNSPRVIWTGIDKGESEVKKIAKELQEKTAEIGVPEEERDFSSHITIGRVRSMRNREKLISELGRLAQDCAQRNPAEFNVSKITLFKSILTPGGPVYEALAEAQLKAT